MKLTNGDVVQAREPLMELMQNKFAVSVSYKLAKLAGKLNEHLKLVEDVRKGLVRKYGEPDKRGNYEIKEDSEKRDAFIKEYSELLGMEVELVADKVRLVDKDMLVEPKLLMMLDKFIEV